MKRQLIVLQTLPICKKPLPDVSGCLHRTDKTDVTMSMINQILHRAVHPDSIVGEHGAAIVIRITKIQKHSPPLGLLHQTIQIRFLNSADDNQLIRLPGFQTPRKPRLCRRLFLPVQDFQSGIHSVLGQAEGNLLIHFPVEGHADTDVPICHKNSDRFLRVVLFLVAGHIIAALAGRLQNLVPHLPADALTAGKSIGNRYRADPGLLRNIT